MPKVRISIEEYLNLVEMAHRAVGTAAATPAVGRRRAKVIAAAGAKIQRKASGTALRGMSKALKAANKKARKKDGSFKKGWTQARVMKEAHRLRRKEK